MALQMETICCSISSTIIKTYNKSGTYNGTTQTYLCFPPTFFPSTFPRNYKFSAKKILNLNRFIHGVSSSNSSSQSQNNSSAQLAVLLEVDGILMDVNRLGNRQAFNIAFQKLGLDCANWSEPVYSDLVRKSAGDEEKMVILFFNRIGWPTSLPTSEKGSFMKSVLREKKNALDELVMSNSLPLRPGFEDFIDDARKEGVPVVILTSYSKIWDKVARPIIEKLGQERMSKIKIVGKEEVDQSLYGQLVFNKGVSSSLNEELTREVAKAVSAEKQRIAKEVASMLQLLVDIDTSSPESMQRIVATLRAGAEYVDVPVCNCVLIAGGQSGVAAAKRIGMPCVVLRSSSTSGAEFPSANAIMDGFGDADLTIAKLNKKRWSQG